MANGNDLDKIFSEDTEKNKIPIKTILILYRKIKKGEIDINSISMRVGTDSNGNPVYANIGSRLKTIFAALFTKITAGQLDINDVLDDLTLNEREYIGYDKQTLITKWGI